MTAVLLSIKPEFAKKIFAGTKKFEFRKSIFKYQNINKIIVYASSPVKKVIGEFLIDKILIDDIDSENSCVIPKEDFIRISKETNYVNNGAGKKIENGLMLLGKDFRIERKELDNIDFSDSSGYFEFISYEIKIPEKINWNAKIWWK